MKTKKNLNVTDLLHILDRSEKPFNDMVDWHIAFFQEPDEKKQKLYYTIYESKREAYEELKRKLFEKYE